MHHVPVPFFVILIFFFVFFQFCDTLFTLFAYPFMLPSKRRFLKKDVVPARAALCLLFLTFFSFYTAGFAQTSALPKARGSYWTSGGTNLIEDKLPLIPFLERKELFRLLRQTDSIVFLDIREPHEFQKSHIPGARNISFSNRHDFFSKFSSDDQMTYIPYCNWDFRAYVAARELKEKGIRNIVMMYPHGLRGWIGSGLPAAGEEAGVDDEEAITKLRSVILNPPSVILSSSTVTLSDSEESMTRDSSAAPQDDTIGETKHITMRLLPKIIEPAHIKASVGDHLIINLMAEGEDHWFVMPDFDIDFHLKQGEQKTIEIDLTKSGYFPFGCITCCVKYQCKIKQAILVDLKEPVSYYGET